MTDKTKICKFFLKNKCNKGPSCSFIHDKDVCKNYFFDGKCERGLDCKFKHIINNDEKPKNNQKEQYPNNKNNKRHKNTENFNPSHKPSHMNILFDSNKNKSTIHKFNDNDIIVVPQFLEESENLELYNKLYNKLLKEIEESGIKNDDLWKLWHGDTHLIADDNVNWKEKVPTFDLITKKIETYFNITAKSTRLNLYKDSNDWKPFHHDAAAFKPEIAKIQDFTVGISFGATRSIAFEQNKTRTTISIPMPNCTAYGFAKGVNSDWKHGIPQINPEESFSDEGRISIIVWGKLKNQ